MMPTLETPRLLLRPFVPGDWDVMNAMLSDPETTRSMHFKTWTEARRREWFDWCIGSTRQPNAGSIQWAIARKDGGDVVGWFGIGAASEPTVTGDISFGYLLDRSH
jgi:RimJ/RimL family protein N-acetyltransferase